MTSNSSALRRLRAVTSMPTETADERGTKVLAAASAIRNVDADMISDYVRSLLESGIWQDYRLPNGNRYQWRSQEFDFFLTVTGLDPALIDHVVRGSGDRVLLVAVAEATSDRADADRRSLEEVAARYPEIADRLSGHPLAGTAVRRLISKRQAQLDFINGKGADSAYRPRKRWEVRWNGADETDVVAEAIVAKLMATPELAEMVLQGLKENRHSGRRIRT